MKTETNRSRFFNFLLIIAIVGAFFAQIQAATLSPKLQKQLAQPADGASVGTAIVAFNTTNGLNDSHLNILRGVGVTSGKTFPNLGMVAMPLTVAQVRALSNNPAVSGSTSANAKTFTVEPNINVLDVFANADTIAETGDGNVVGLRLTSPSGVRYSGGIDLPVIGSTAREVTVQNPEAGTWTIEVRGASGLTTVPVNSPTQLAAPGQVDGTFTQIKYVLPTIQDIQGNAAQTQIETAIKSRLIDTFADGTFRPDAIVTREDFARTMLINTPNIRTKSTFSFLRLICSNTSIICTSAATAKTSVRAIFPTHIRIKPIRCPRPFTSRIFTSVWTTTPANCRARPTRIRRRKF